MLIGFGGQAMGPGSATRADYRGSIHRESEEPVGPIRVPDRRLSCLQRVRSTAQRVVAYAIDGLLPA